jgi:hypothetical protein
MTSRDFVIWLRGFVTATNNYNVTPAQWDALKDNLDKVDDFEWEWKWDEEPNDALIEASKKYKELTSEENKIF